MTVNKIADGSRGEHHHPHRDHHCRHHDEQMIRQADGGDHWIEAKDDIQQHDLHDGAEEGVDVGLQPLLFTFDRFMDLFTGFPDKE